MAMEIVSLPVFPCKMVIFPCFLVSLQEGNRQIIRFILGAFHLRSDESHLVAVLSFAVQKPSSSDPRKKATRQGATFSTATPCHGEATSYLNSKQW